MTVNKSSLPRGAGPSVHIRPQLWFKNKKDIDWIDKTEETDIFSGATIRTSIKCYAYTSGNRFGVGFQLEPHILVIRNKRAQKKSSQEMLNFAPMDSSDDEENLSGSD